MEIDSKEEAVRREKTPISKNLQIDSETWYLLMHEYLSGLFRNHQKNQQTKNAELEVFASIIGRNIAEICTDDKIAKYRLTKDIVNFIGIDIWNLLFTKRVTNIISKDDEVYLLMDNNFHFMKRIPPDDEKAREYVSFCTVFVARLLKSILRTFLIETEILAETPDYVEYNFTIKVKPPPAA
jgi:hypothetical protein